MSMGMGRIPRIGIVFGILLCLVCIQWASAYAGEYHYDLTSDALKDEGIGIDHPQNAYIYVNNELVDMISIAHDNQAADDYLIPDVFPNSNEIEGLFSDKAHFQYYPDNANISKEWDRLLEATYLSVKVAENSGDKRELLVTLGMSLHTVQDFYAHSNWSELTDDGSFAAKGYEGDVTWFDVQEKDKNATSGLVIHSMDHAGIHKDYPYQSHFDTSYREAYYASRQWIRLVKSWVSEDFWNAAMDPNIDTSTWGGIIGEDIPLYEFFRHILWYSGAWNYDYSESDTMLVLFGIDHGFVFPDAWHLEHDPEYRTLYSITEDIGYSLLYNQAHFTPTPVAHPETLTKIPDVRWLRIQTYRVKQTDCDYSWDIDPATGNEADFYNKIIVSGHHYYIEAPNQGADDFVPKAWVIHIPLPIEAETVDVRYELWDEDYYGDLTVSDDDHCDIVYEYDKVDWEHTLSTASPWTYVNTNGLRDCTWYYGSYGDGDEARVVFSYEFIPQNEGAAIGLAKKVSKLVIHSGDSVTYTYNVTNAGSRPLANVAVTDNAGIIPSYASGDTNDNGKLDLLETWTYTATTTLTTEEKTVNNTATGTATDAIDAVKIVTATAKETVKIIHPSILVEKSASSYSIDRGESVTYTYTVTNTGDIQLTDIQLTDDKVTPMYQGGDTDSDDILNLTETWTYTATSSPLTHTVTNTATVQGTDPLELTVSSADSATVVVTVLVNVDVKPGGCPNGFGLKDKGVVPVAILGGLPDYTIDEINTSSIKLNGVPTLKILPQDAATPYLGTATCGCHILTRDGIPDVLFQFDAPKVVGTLGNPAKKSIIPLTLTGTLKDGITLVKGSDCVKIS